MASVVRETLAEAFGTEVKKPRWTIDDFTFIGMGRDSNNPREPGCRSTMTMRWPTRTPTGIGRDESDLR